MDGMFESSVSSLVDRSSTHALERMVKIVAL